MNPALETQSLITGGLHIVHSILLGLDRSRQFTANTAAKMKLLSRSFRRRRLPARDGFMRADGGAGATSEGVPAARQARDPLP